MKKVLLILTCSFACVSAIVFFTVSYLHYSEVLEEQDMYAKMLEEFGAYNFIDRSALFAVPHVNFFEEKSMTDAETYTHIEKNGMEPDRNGTGLFLASLINYSLQWTVFTLLIFFLFIIKNSLRLHTKIAIIAATSFFYFSVIYYLLGIWGANNITGIVYSVEVTPQKINYIYLASVIVSAAALLLGIIKVGKVLISRSKNT